MERLVLENAQRPQSQTVYQQKFNQLSGAIDQKRAMIQDIEQRISAMKARVENVCIFLNGLRSIVSGSLVTQFDIKLWHSLVEYATVTSDRAIIFHYRSGNEETVRLEEAQ